MKLILVCLSLMAAPALAQHESGRVQAREACADDYWKWCPSTEAPYDCFKRRGFFKKDSILSLDCKKAWLKPKSKSEPAAEKPPEQEVAPAPNKLNAQPKKQPASAPPQEPEKNKTDPETDDFDNLDFQ